ncbi:hypothetical protein [Desulfohalovibrio reitneri]|uniref:hypothetical protein n=1 Tax=Desulfohalovibrio reitneri TaxID=1307759 RepID=UPI0013781C59|nr:hypothetical protein [Desulfohalovibrio reitneri]
MGLLGLDPVWDEDSGLGNLLRHARNLLRFGPGYVRAKLTARRSMADGVVAVLPERLGGLEGEGAEARARRFVDSLYRDMQAFRPAPLDCPAAGVVAEEWTRAGLAPFRRSLAREPLVRWTRCLHNEVFQARAAEVSARAVDEVFGLFT